MWTEASAGADQKERHNRHGKGWRLGWDRGQKQHSLDQVGGQDFLADGLLGQCQPELAGLKGHVLIVVLGPLQHVLGWDGRKAKARPG